MTAEEAGSSTMQNVLVRALGIDPVVEVDVSEELVIEGDTILLCSDGLTRELSDAQIAAVLGEGDEAKEAARPAGGSRETGRRRRQRDGDRAAPRGEAGGRVCTHRQVDQEIGVTPRKQIFWNLDSWEG